LPEKEATLPVDKVEEMKNAHVESEQRICGETEHSSLEEKLKMKKEKLTIAIPEDNGKLPYQLQNSNSKIILSPMANRTLPPFLIKS